MTRSEQTHIIWHKSTASSSSDCVEVAVVDGSVLVRNSRDPLGSVLSFSRQDWTAFLKGVDDGQFTRGETDNDTA